VKLIITRQQAENLKLDAKTLVDISRLLEMDGRFKVVPGILDGIASDILEAFKIEPERKFDEILGQFGKT
jgi:hypothetical protein